LRVRNFILGASYGTALKCFGAVPFVKTETAWRFDAKTYMSFKDFASGHNHHGN
jgi:hypothetical protein